MTVAPAPSPSRAFGALDAAVADLTAGKDDWAATTVAQRMEILSEIKDALLPVSEAWAEIAARKKLIPAGSPLIGEEWMSGPYALMLACNGLRQSLSQIEGKTYLAALPKRETTTGQLAVKIVPHGLWDRLLLSGVNAEVWMQPGITRATLAAHTATAYETAPNERAGKVALVLGAGNIASIAPLDCFQKLFLEHQVVLLKLNPVNDYLLEVFQAALKPLIARNALRIVKGGAAEGAYLTSHPDIDELHITGAQSTHDAIIWGAGDEGDANKAAGTPKNTRRITSELGAVCPTIVVPGPWSAADIGFQAEHIATQKMHNSGFNCIACQTLILAQDWPFRVPLMQAVTRQIAAAQRLAYYPGAADRLENFAAHGENITHIKRGDAPDAVILEINDTSAAFAQNTEFFAPALATYRINETEPEAYLRAAISYANESLHGTLGANIIIHPKTIRAIGKNRFETIIAELRYGCIAINAWTGLGFLLSPVPWGAFPGHTLDDVQSGIGFVHNTFMFDSPERTILEAPWRPFPRNLLSGEFTLLPKPPWFITNTRQHKIGKLLTEFQYKPSWSKLPRLFLNALLG